MSKFKRCAKIITPVRAKKTVTPHPEHHGQKAEMQRVEKGKEISVGGGKKNNGKESLEKEV